jgi:hypothetical protein
VIVNDLDIFGAAISPDKAHAPLVVDADAPLSSAVTFQPLEPISGRHPQSVNGNGRIQHGKLTLRHAHNIRGKASGGLPIPDRLRRAPFEAPDYPMFVSQ